MTAGAKRARVSEAARQRAGLRRVAATVLVTIMVAWVPALAFADPAAEARLHDALARKHFEGGDYEAALREFFLEQRIAPNPRISFNIALCFMELRRRDEAYMAFREYLSAENTSEERRSYAEKKIAELEEHLARVRVESTPRGARIFVDRRELGEYGVTPAVLAIPAGERAVILDAPGHYPTELEVTARRGELSEVHADLERIEGRLHVTSSVDGRVIVQDPDGKDVATDEAPLDARLPPDTYRVVVTAPGHERWHEVVRVHPDATRDLRANPKPLPPPAGDVTVTSNYAGAVVSLDGEQVGFTPLVLADVPEGEHRFRVEREGLAPLESTVGVSAGERAWLTVSLEEPQVEERSVWTWITGGIGIGALAAGAVVGGVALAKRNDFQDRRSEGDPAMHLWDQTRTLSRTADALLAVGAVGLITGVVLYFTTLDSRRKESSATVARQPL